MEKAGSELFRVKGLPLLDILIDEGSCMNAPRGHNQTPSRPTDAPRGGSEWLRYETTLAQATAYCLECSVQLECAVYSTANQAAGINGNNVIKRPERQQRDKILHTKTSFDEYIVKSIGLRKRPHCND